MVANNGFPKFTVIIAVFNGLETIRQCLDSVTGQSYSNVEIIVIDGGSNDGSVGVIESYSSKLAYWVSEKDNGIYNAWNKGLAHATGDWVCFIGVDDYFVNHDVLQKMAPSLSGVAEEIDIVYGRILLLGTNDQPLYELGAPWPQISKKFKNTMCLPHPGLMHRRTVFKKFGGFNEKYKIAADYDFLLRALFRAQAQYLPDQLTVAMRQGGVSSSPQNTFRALKEVRQAQLGVGLTMPSLTWLLAYSRVSLRLLLWKLVGESNARLLLDWGRRWMGLPPYWTKTK